MFLNSRLLDLLRKSQSVFVGAIISGLIGGLLTILQARLLSILIGDVFLKNAKLYDLTGLFIALLVIILVRSGLVWLMDVFTGRVATDVKHRVREELIQKIWSLGPAYAWGESSAELTTTVTEGVEALDAYFRQYLPQLVFAVAIPLTILLIVFPLDWLTGIVFLATAPLIPVFMRLIGSISEALTRRQWDALRRMSVFFLDSIQGIMTLKTLRQSRQQVQRIREVSEKYRATTFSVLKVTFLSALILEWVGTISIAVVAVEIGLRLLYGRMVFEDAFFILLIAPEFYLPLRLLGQRFHAGIGGFSTAKRIFLVMDQPVTNPVSQSSNTDFGIPSEFNLRFDHVSYRYPSRIEDAVKDISLEFKSGQICAVVGTSGAGKSTLANLLLRFCDPHEGKIFLNDLAINEIPLEVWRSWVAWVPQQPYLFQGTIASNICLGCKSVSEEDLIRATNLAGLGGWIAGLPAGYQTLIGERGIGLSRGQAQCVSLARAFLKNSPLLVMDEPTASLDPELDMLLEKAVLELCCQKTVFLIAHRLETITNANIIYVMEKGKVVDSGTHSELARTSISYMRLLESYGVVI
ncbi:MAG: thiol reductant ABC exporter subunit CydD [Anaerolineales bacterium]